MLPPRLTVCAIALSWAGACIYPRHATPSLTVTQSPVDRATQPEHLWQLQVVRVDIPRQKRTGSSWDEDGGAPDPYIVLRVGGNERWRTEAAEDSFDPKFTPSPNLAFDRAERLRIELWDRDGMASDPIGMYEGKFLSDIILDADTALKMDGGASVTLRLRKPEPKQGVGIEEYELRPAALVVMAVTPNSPASRAKLKSGDRIVAIEGKAVRSMSPEQAETALSLAAQNRSELTVERGKAKTKRKLDNGYIWPAQ